MLVGGADHELVRLEAALRMTKRTVSPSRTCSAFSEKALSVATISTGA